MQKKSEFNYWFAQFLDLSIVCLHERILIIIEITLLQNRYSIKACLKIRQLVYLSNLKKVPAFAIERRLSILSKLSSQSQSEALCGGCWYIAAKTHAFHSNVYFATLYVISCINNRVILRSSVLYLSKNALLWRHNGRDSVSNHQHHDCLLNRFWRRWK